MASPLSSAAIERSFAEPLSDVGPNGERRPMLGKSAVNDPVYAPYRPSVLSLANEMTLIADSDGVQPERLIPVPHGWSFAQHTVKKRTQFQLTVDLLYARNKLRRVFGYVAELQLFATANGSVSFDP